MWPLCVFVNKLLNLEEVAQNSSDCSLSGSCSLKFSSTDEIEHDVMLPRVHFIEVYHHSLINFSFRCSYLDSLYKCFHTFVIFLQVPHVNQLSNWDCGLACVLMVLQTIGINNCSLHTLEKLCGTRRCALFALYNILNLPAMWKLTH